MLFTKRNRSLPLLRRLTTAVVFSLLIVFTSLNSTIYEPKQNNLLGKIINANVVCATETVPDITPQKLGTNVYSNSKAQIDASNLSEGYIIVRYTGGKSVPIKIQITKKSGITYTYNLSNTGAAEIYSLTEGDGEYQVNVMENISGTSYALGFGQTVQLRARNNLLPFMYPNQFVDYSTAVNTISQAKQLAAGGATDLDKLTAIYQYIVKNFTYDYELARTVTSGYVPKVDSVLNAKKGICFDYASLACSMLRSQNIPSKLVIGYAGDAYHAWINVYIETIGWIEKFMYFDGKKFYLMDPTFASSGRSSPEIYKYIGDGANYRVKYVH